MNRLILAIMLFVYGRLFADDFMGFTFGQNPQDVDEIIKSGPMIVAYLEKTENNYGAFSVSYSGNNRLKGAKKTTFSFFDDKLTAILVTFKETEADAKRTYKALAHKLIEKYGQNYSKNVPGACIWRVNSRTISLYIEEGLFSAKVNIECYDQRLAQEKEQQLLQRKSSEIGDL